MAVTREAIVNVFRRKTGYKEDDIAAINITTLVVVTWDGGKYKVGPKQEVRRLQGPPSPKEGAPVEEPEEEGGTE
jgi:hypothetical protein